MDVLTGRHRSNNNKISKMIHNQQYIFKSHIISGGQIFINH